MTDDYRSVNVVALQRERDELRQELEDLREAYEALRLYRKGEPVAYSGDAVVERLPLLQRDASTAFRENIRYATWCFVGVLSAISLLSSLFEWFTRH